MSNPAVPASADGRTDRLATALGRWSVDPLLAPLLPANGAALLVLDDRGERILHASPSAAPVRAALADPSGRLHAALGLADQIRRLGPLSGKPRIARLRLDPRGIAPGTPCQIARAPLEDGTTALLVAPLVAAPLAAARTARAQNGAAQAQPASEPPAAAARPATVDEPAPAGRLIWRSDAEGVLTQVSGVGAGIAAAFLGRSWQAIGAQAGPAEADALLEAMREGRTFRALPVTVRLTSPSRRLMLDVSGAPSGRPNGALAGFAGFAVIRAHESVSEPDIGPEPDGANTSDVGASTGPPSQEPPPDASVTAQPAVQVPDPRPNDTTQDRRPPSAQPAPGSSPGLSTDEHAAFREIARALGARFVGDAPRASIAAESPSPSPGEPSSAPAPAATDRAGTADALAAVFDRLPVGILVRRGDDILFANRLLLDLAGQPDLQALRQSGSLSSLLGAADAVTTVTNTAGESVRLAAEHSSLDWDGRPASLILTRRAPEPAPAASAPTAAPAEDREPVPRTVLDASEDGVVTLDADGHVLRLNPKAEAILADAAPRIVGKRFASLIAANESAPDDVDRRRSNGAAAPSSATLGEGSATPLRVRIGRLLSADDSPLYATLQDMADAKHGEEEAAARHRLEEAARRKLAFFAKAGEAVRGPLNGIVGHADALLAERFGTLGSERSRETLREIHASGAQALGQLNDLVELAEIASGRIDLAFADLPLNDLVARCIADVQAKAAQRRIVLRTSLADDLRPLHADERSLRNAAIKVLGNAIRLTEAGGQVIVSTTLAEAGGVALRVRDTGSGMSAEQVDRALDPFGRPSMPVARDEGGAGLGLTLTKALVEANRGTLRVTSRQDEGTLVEMIFPAKAASA